MTDAHPTFASAQDASELARSAAESLTSRTVDKDFIEFALLAAAPQSKKLLCAWANTVSCAAFSVDHQLATLTHRGALHSGRFRTRTT